MAGVGGALVSVGADGGSSPASLGAEVPAVPSLGGSTRAVGVVGGAGLVLPGAGELIGTARLRMVDVARVARAATEEHDRRFQQLTPWEHEIVGCLAKLEVSSQLEAVALARQR